MRRHTLTDREDAAMRCLVLGDTYAQIGEALGITMTTAKFHLRNAYAKLGAVNAAHAAAMYARLSDVAIHPIAPLATVVPVHA